MTATVTETTIEHDVFLTVKCVNELIHQMSSLQMNHPHQMNCSRPTSGGIENVQVPTAACLPSPSFTHGHHIFPLSIIDNVKSIDAMGP